MFQANMTAIIPSIEYSVVIFLLENPPISCLGTYRETFRTIERIKEIRKGETDDLSKY